jgi:enterobacteria phage integrase
LDPPLDDEACSTWARRRVDTVLLTWHRVDTDATYIRRKTGVAVEMAVAEELQKALEATLRKHVTVINTKYGRPYTVDGLSRFMRDAITAAGLPLECQPHGLRKTLGRLMADAGCTAHGIMAALGHTTLVEAEIHRQSRSSTRRQARRDEAQRKSEEQNSPNRI